MNPVTARMIRFSGRSWWQARFYGGRIVSEWDTLVNTILTPFGKGSTSRWETLDKYGMIGLRILCPNGMAAELVAQEGHKLFQFKVGVRSVGNPYSMARSQVIGLVLNSEGDCLCRAWEVERVQMHEGVPVILQPAKLIEFQDNIFRMRYENIGRLSLEVQGIRL